MQINKKKKVIIFGSKKNNCQELDLFNSLNDRGLEAEIWNRRSLPRRLKKIKECDNSVLLIRNLFYSLIKNYDNYEVEDVVKKLRRAEEKLRILNSIDGLVILRDKLKMCGVFRQLRIPYIKTYSLENKPSELVKWVNDTADDFSNGVIIKDRYGGLGKGVLKAKKQGSLYICDISCVEGVETKYINETLNTDDLKELFKKYMSGYELIGQPYIKSTHEFNTINESESIRVLDIGGSSFVAMKRIAESPINNLSLTKNKVVNGDVQTTRANEQERKFSKRLSEHLNLFFIGYDFIRTNLAYYRDDPGAVYVPSNLRGEENVSLMLEVNGLVQFGGIQELYKDKFDLTEYVVSAIEEELE